jgi:hypothetical protein
MTQSINQSVGRSVNQKQDSPEPLTLQQQLVFFTPSTSSGGGCSWGLEACLLAAQCLEASDRWVDARQCCSASTRVTNH